jgi:hypothetical protein
VLRLAYLEIVKSVSILTTAYGFQVDIVYCSFNTPSLEPLKRPMISGANAAPGLVKAAAPNGSNPDPITGPAGPAEAGNVVVPGGSAAGQSLWSLSAA